MRRISVTAVSAGLVLGFALLGETVSQRWFTDVTKQAGIDARHGNRVFDNPYAKIMAGYTALGASASVADFDGDGFEDVFVTDSKLGSRNHLYRNNGNFTFTDVAEKAGVANGHCLINRTNRDARIIEIGTRAAGELAHYPEIDMKVVRDEKGSRYTRKDGTPF